MIGASNRPEPSLSDVMEEYLTRVDKGESPDTQEYIARHPNWARELREFFDDLSFVDARIATEKAAVRSVGLGRWFGKDEASSHRGDACRTRGNFPRLQEFDILEELGSGGQGVVYKAQQLGTKRIVALKVIREGTFASQVERRRFESEVELASRLNHPNIVSLYVCGQESGHDYFAMEYVEGEPLDVYMGARTLDIPTTLQLFLQLCDAVGYAHQHGVIHRDLKPSNVIVDRTGRVRVLDFGLAKAIATGSPSVSSRLTDVGAFAGTWHYASPEQAKKDPDLVDVRSDVYTLGVMLYEMLTDTYPYPLSDESRDTIARHVLYTAPVPPSRIRREIDDELETITLCALRKEPYRRYQSVAALGEDIRRYLSGEAIDAKRDSSWYVVRKALKRHRWRVAGVGTALGALIVFALTVSILYSRAIAARATTEVRTRIVRASQQYLTDRLDEFNWASNRLTEITEAHPTLPEVQALNRDVYENHAALFAATVLDVPGGIVDTILSRDGAGYNDAVEWLSAHRDELAQVETLARTKRFVFEVERRDHSDLAIRDHPGPLGQAMQLGEALVARALYHYRQQDHGAAISSLEAARSIALDLGDGRLLLHKGVAVRVRSKTYDGILMILAETSEDDATADAYTDWALRDPPLTRYALAMVSERQKLSQLCEGASFASSPHDSGYVSLEHLNVLSGGLYSRVSPSATVHTIEGSVSPKEMLEAIDVFTGEAEQWDALPFEALKEHWHNVVSRLEHSPAWSVMKPVLPSLKLGFKDRARINAKRSATLLAAYLRRYRANRGRWPHTMSEAIPPNARIDNVDPYTRRPFGYKLIDDAPLLYSVNEDGVDNGGYPGRWGEDGTDVVLFVPRSR